MRDAKSGERERNYRWRCRGCKRMFTVRTDTVFEETRLPMRVWAYAFWKACASKKGISALQISREMQISYKSALFLMHRVRHALGDDGPAPLLSGTVEMDETYVGGKPRGNYGNTPPDPARRSRRSSRWSSAAETRASSATT
jgi:hypothetical protein